MQRRHPTRDGSEDRSLHGPAVGEVPVGCVGAVGRRVRHVVAQGDLQVRPRIVDVNVCRHHDNESQHQCQNAIRAVQLHDKTPGAARRCSNSSTLNSSSNPATCDESKAASDSSRTKTKRSSVTRAIGGRACLPGNRRLTANNANTLPKSREQDGQFEGGRHIRGQRIPRLSAHVDRPTHRRNPVFKPQHPQRTDHCAGEAHPRQARRPQAHGSVEPMDGVGRENVDDLVATAADLGGRREQIVLMVKRG